MQISYLTHVSKCYWWLCHVKLNPAKAGNVSRPLIKQGSAKTSFKTVFCYADLSVTDSRKEEYGDLYFYFCIPRCSPPRRPLGHLSLHRTVKAEERFPGPLSVSSQDAMLFTEASFHQA